MARKIFERALTLLLTQMNGKLFYLLCESIRIIAEPLFGQGNFKESELGLPTNLDFSQQIWSDSGSAVMRYRSHFAKWLSERGMLKGLAGFEARQQLMQWRLSYKQRVCDSQIA